MAASKRTAVNHFPPRLIHELPLVGGIHGALDPVHDVELDRAVHPVRVIPRVLGRHARDELDDVPCQGHKDDKNEPAPLPADPVEAAVQGPRRGCLEPRVLVRHVD